MSPCEEAFEPIPWEGTDQWIRAGMLNLLNFKLSCLCETAVLLKDHPKLTAQTFVIDGVVVGKLRCTGCHQEYTIEVRAAIKRETPQGPYRFRRVPDYNA